MILSGHPPASSDIVSFELRVVLRHLSYQCRQVECAAKVS